MGRQRASGMTLHPPLGSDYGHSAYRRGAFGPCEEPAPDLDRLVDEVIGLRGLLGDGVDGVLEDLALTACHEVRLNRCYDSNRETRA
jgi:hypothetical protein